MIDYKGYKHLTLTDEQLSDLYAGRLELEGFVKNEYLISDGEDSDYFQWNGEKFVKIRYPIIETEFGGQIKPRNPEQYCAFDLLKNNDIPIKLITGKFGSGKSLACITAALEAVEKHTVEKIIFVRNNVQVKDTDPIGALPGDQNSKFLPYLGPFCDHVGGLDGVMHLMETGQLEVIPLGFLRGRSIRNSILYSMESENLTKEHIQLLMGRVDEGSQLWLDGDLKQRDKSIFEKSAGLETMIQRLAGEKLFGYVHLVKSERSEIAAMADLLD